MQKIVGDRLRPPGKHDPFGVEQAEAALLTAYGVIEQEMATNTWATGEAFSMGDCSAAPALFYGNLVLPFGDAHPHTAAYFARLMARPSFARVVKQAEPYMKLFPR
jgi:glutathione S-transferase